MKFLLLGYYGFFNSGDDAILHAVCQDIKSQDENCEITVMSNNPESTEKEYGVRAIKRYDMVAVLKEMRKADIVIFGGGSLLQDVTSSRSLQYYLTIMRLATMMKKKTMLYANGVGPINNLKNQKATVRVLNKLNVLTVRDRESYNFLFRIGINQEKLKLSADPVYNIKSEKSDVDKLLAKHSIERNGEKYVAVVFRTFGEDLSYTRDIAKVCDKIYEEFNLRILFAPMEYPGDFQLSHKIQNEMKHKSWVLKERAEVDKLIDIIGGAHIILGMRLHGLIYATLNNVPIMAFSYDPKINSFCKQLGVETVVDYNNFDSDEVFSMVKEILDNYDENKIKLEENYKIMQKKTLVNREVLNELMKD